MMELPLGLGGLDRPESGPREEFEMLDWIPLDDEYRGFKLKWTGWKSSLISMEIAGQWVAYGFMDCIFVVNLPNFWTGRVRRGEQFDIFPMTAEQAVSTDKAADRLLLIEKGKKCLIDAIDRYLVDQ